MNTNEVIATHFKEAIKEYRDENISKSIKTKESNQYIIVLVTLT